MGKHTVLHGNSKRQPVPLSRRRTLWTLGLGALSALGGGAAWRATRAAPPEDPAAASVLAPQQELRPTLEPAQFTGKARRAYEVARQIPGVLDRLHCYCRCDPYGHRTLLSCYTDHHAAT